MKLADLAQVVRSKNAGPTQLTLDIFFRDAAAWQRACASERLSPAGVAALYGLTAGQVERYLLPEILAIKLSLARTVCAGSPGDGDVYGAQQHAPLLGIEL
ncbi:DUF4387 domain-containing protein [Verticiella sediminum]|uniref:DUF4387 domain-containing protein n=1 Tax=Verticiella sediminum TaxID=1247510 RepID=A0A556AE75_9BURK|nr:DUF4387 domain-containing protein [Verticiella sediminum]TSH91190.1 DUF4387 domain-containing protein [Verticiella sediminum]